MAETMRESGLVKIGITEANGDCIELRGGASRAAASPKSSTNGVAAGHAAKQRAVDVITSDLVGIAHLARAGLSPGSEVEPDRELGYVEALGIRTPLRSLNRGRIARILVAEGDPVEYGQALFEIERV